MPIREYDASEYLETPEDIAEYLNVVMEEMSDDDDPRLLMMALRNVVKARGGVSALARETGLNRAALSRALSGQRVPRLDTFSKLSAACGVKLRFSA
jgi:probable addiction module antidote protein